MAYYAVLGEVPVKRKLDFIEFNSSELIMQLRHAIYDKKKNTFSKQNIDESDLMLWKVDIPFGNENDKLKMLDDTPRTINVERDLEGKEMLSGDPISDHLEHFDKTRLSIHILVQPPLPTATTGKCLPMVCLSNKKFAVTKYNFNVIFYLFLATGQKRSADSGIFLPPRN